jgi:membrane protease YdiL (CAAX protease family)
MSAIAADFALVRWGAWELVIEARGVLAVAALALLVRLTAADLPSLGLRMAPEQGWWYWVRMTLLIGAAVGACIVVGLGLWVLAGGELPMPVVAPADIPLRLFSMCVTAPVIEETLYRLALCVPLTALLGPWRTVVVSGVLFGLLHVAYGNPSPENLVGGLFLAWAYLKSGSITVPVLLHSLGNAVALGSQVAGWYWLTPLQ